MLRLFKTLGPVVVVLAAVLGTALPAVALDLPDQLVKYLPANPDVLVVAPSLKEMQRAWGEMQTLSEKMTDEEDEPLPALDSLLQEQMGPELYGMIDQDRPLAMALTIPSMMSGQQPVFTGVIPVKGDKLDIGQIPESLPVTTILQENGYVLLSQAPTFEEAAEPTRLLDHLTDNPITVCLDLKSVWGNFGPMLDFILAAMNAPQPPAEGQDEATPPAMTREQTVAMGDMIRDVMNSADVVTMAADFRGDQILFSEEFATLPGTPMSPTPQPDFTEALELTRLLPHDADWVAAYSLDFGQMMEIYKEFYRTSLEMQFQAMGEESSAALAELLETNFKFMDKSFAPTVLAMKVRNGSPDLVYAMKTSEAAEYIAMQEQIAEKAGAAVPWMKITPVQGLEIDGLEVHAWDYEWNAEALMEFTGQNQDENLDPENFATLTSFLADFMPGLRMASRDDLLFASMSRDLAPLADMIEQSRHKREAVNPKLAKLAREAGPGCQAVFQGDLTTILTMVFSLAAEMSDEDIPTVDLDPLPLSYAVNIDQDSYRAEYRLGLQGIDKLVAFLKELDDDDEDGPDKDDD